MRSLDADADDPAQESSPESDDSAVISTPAEAASLNAARPEDPWAHRRGEPRVFALLWTVYLFAITGWVFFAALAGPSISPEVMRPAARMMLFLTAAGAALLWPMVRLSQTPDPNPRSGVFQDLLVVMIPAQALIWPQVLWWLARWPLGTVAAVSASMAAWGLLLAALLAIAQSGNSDAPAGGRRPARNIGWMLVFTVIAIGGPLISMLGGHSAPPAVIGDAMPQSSDITLMLSPIGSILELTRDTAWSGRSTPLSAAHWWSILAVAAAAALLWGWLGMRGRQERIGLRYQT
jgi:hypothetical protein